VCLVAEDLAEDLESEALVVIVVTEEGMEKVRPTPHLVDSQRWSVVRRSWEVVEILLGLLVGMVGIVVCRRCRPICLVEILLGLLVGMVAMGEVEEGMEEEMVDTVVYRLVCLLEEVGMEGVGIGMGMVEKMGDIRVLEHRGGQVSVDVEKE